MRGNTDERQKAVPAEAEQKQPRSEVSDREEGVDGTWGPITRDHVQELLNGRQDGSTLVVLEGHAQVVPTKELGSDRYAGALEIMTAEELARQVGTSSPAEHDVHALTTRLNTWVAKLGG
jgi:hypothetical protein